ncbi:hypothetical protein HNY73_008228 [Argiope bruennichi]|uniref:Uncharacterized protein n=1 Tax=Argiope bruennichi TaxID=94029 RepID=A0A8T0F876_ARGBR|nr:hypothetical protein HNY73_008228 [Argiope bruennichi]
MNPTCHFAATGSLARVFLAKLRRGRCAPSRAAPGKRWEARPAIFCSKGGRVLLFGEVEGLCEREHGHYRLRLTGPTPFHLRRRLKSRRAEK